ncbi:hypothetical protein CBR_g46424 [Chara braunii]|uniref:Integrase zinc-binding domain-containing protein n=1 Tax=Chara braunii TaxID=69332 RepID=A0A388M0L8_CHABU|nr:hypothetical protein CBR_g46424 [Chara braunii]|eukprot:GBG88055.1 hypothetical protein CBR_g46424 [Chara braunii]
MASYYRRFIKGFAGVAKPLTNLLKKEEQLIWTPKCEAAFQTLKKALTSAPVLARDSLSELTKAERRRVTERAQDYCWQGLTLQKRKVDDGGGTSWLTVPHPFARFDWTRAAHEEDAVHFAVKYTEKAIEKSGWYRSGIREDVKYIVQNCPACVADKAPVQMPRTMMPTRVERPLQRVSIDMTDINVPRGPVDQGELNVLLVVVNHFSKRIEAYPMTSRNSQEVAWMNHRQPEHEPLEHFQTPLADRLLRHQFNEERQLRYDIQQVNVPAPGIADLAAYSLLCDRLMYAGVYVDVTQLPGWETTRVFIEFRALQVAPNFVHSVATFIGDLTILPSPSRELTQSFVREYAMQAARSTIDPGLLELIHLEFLSIAQDIASEEEKIQPRLRTATAPWRTNNAVVIPDYIAQHAERLEDFPEEKPLQPPSSYPRPAPPKAPKKMPKRKRRHPSPGAQGSRIGGDEEVIQPARTRNLDPALGSAATLVKATVVPSPPFPRVPDLNLDGAGPSSAAAAGGGSRMGIQDPISRPPVLARPLRSRQPPRGAPIIDISSSSEPDGPSDRGGFHGGAHHHQARGHRGGAAP